MYFYTRYSFYSIHYLQPLKNILGHLLQREPIEKSESRWFLRTICMIIGTLNFVDETSLFETCIDFNNLQVLSEKKVICNIRNTFVNEPYTVL